MNRKGSSQWGNKFSKKGEPQGINREVAEDITKLREKVFIVRMELFKQFGRDTTNLNTVYGMTGRELIQQYYIVKNLYLQLKLENPFKRFFWKTKALYLRFTTDMDKYRTAILGQRNDRY